MQAEPSCSWLPALARGMREQRLIRLPGLARIRADPETRRVNASIDQIGFTLASRLNHPDVIELQFSVLGKLNAALRFLPGLTKVVAIANERTKEITVFSSK